MQQYTSEVQAEYGSLEKALHIAASPGRECGAVLTQQATQQLLTLLLLLPHGVVKHSHTVEGKSWDGSCMLTPAYLIAECAPAPLLTHFQALSMA